jgi:hypothetical protein
MAEIQGENLCASYRWHQIPLTMPGLSVFSNKPQKFSFTFITGRVLLNKPIKIVIAVVLGLAPAIAYSQSYYYTGPVIGFLEVGLNPASTEGVFSGFGVNFGTVTETLDYNAAAQTLEEIGSVTISPSASGVFDLLGNLETGSFNRPVVGTASLTVGNNNSFSFDYTYSLLNPSVYQFTGMPIPVSGTATYQGQMLSGTWDLDAMAFPTVLSATSTTLTFTEGNGEVYLLPGPGAMPGIVAGDFNDTYNSSWYVSGIATAVEDDPVPDETAILPEAIMALGAMVIFSWRFQRNWIA